MLHMRIASPGYVALVPAHRGLPRPLARASHGGGASPRRAGGAAPASQPATTAVTQLEL